MFAVNASKVLVLTFDVLLLLFQVAYTFDAGPNAVMFAKNKEVAVQLLKRLLYQFPPSAEADLSRYDYLGHS